MTSDPSPGKGACQASWQRFNDEFFSLQPKPNSKSSGLVFGLAAQGIELIVDARRASAAEERSLAADCEEAGLYYVPTGTGKPADRTPGAVTRYANLALRHKTCLMVEDEDETLLRLIAEQGFSRVTPLDEQADDLRPPGH